MTDFRHEAQDISDLSSIHLKRECSPGCIRVKSNHVQKQGLAAKITITRSLATPVPPYFHIYLPTYDGRISDFNGFQPEIPIILTLEPQLLHFFSSSSSTNSVVCVCHVHLHFKFHGLSLFNPNFHSLSLNAAHFNSPISVHFLHLNHYSQYITLSQNEDIRNHYTHIRGSRCFHCTGWRCSPERLGLSNSDGKRKRFLCWQRPILHPRHRLSTW